MPGLVWTGTYIVTHNQAVYCLGRETLSNFSSHLLSHFCLPIFTIRRSQFSFEIESEPETKSLKSYFRPVSGRPVARMSEAARYCEGHANVSIWFCISCSAATQLGITS